MAAIKTPQLKGQIKGVLKNYPDARIIGFKSKDHWPEETTLEIDGATFFVTQCFSQLAIREAIIHAESRNNGLVFVTDIDDLSLSNDIRSILTRRKLIKVKPWDSVKDLFQANVIDGNIYQKSWLADFLLSHAPAEGYKVAPSGFLSAERIWGEVLSILLRFPTPCPDAMEILEWSLNTSLVMQLQKLPDDQFTDICQWIEPHSNSLEVFMLQILKDNSDINLLALGLVFEIIASDLPKENNSLRDAAIRVEKYTGNQPIPDKLSQKWIDASLAVYQKLTVNNDKSHCSSIQDSLASFLANIGLKDYAWLSSVSNHGFEQRLIQYAKGINSHINTKKDHNYKALYESLLFAEKHLESARSPKRMERMRMAFRLLNWLSNDPAQNGKEPKTFVDAAYTYIKDGGFVDRARDGLRTGDECHELNQAYLKVLKQVGAIREIQNKYFAENLKKWTESGSEGDNIIKIEDFLETIVAPIAKDNRILFIVLDGMNMSVFSELMTDLIWNNAWIEVIPDGGYPPKPVIAALPTITEVSRKSLLCGKLTANSKDDEKKCFENNSFLKSAAGSSKPKLFLKGDISSSEGKALSELVRNEIYSSRRKIVASVVNAVDDYLSSNDQMSSSWCVEEISIFSQLLYAARESERIVIITSDHGHLLDFNTKLSNSDYGDRWRPDDGNIQNGEIAIQGSRVLKTENGKIIAPFNETIRYGKKKNGYHGGVSPQEVVIPYTILKWQQIEKGWSGIPFYQPEWWDIRIEEIQTEIDKPIPDKKPKPIKAIEKGQYLLFSGNKTSIPVSAEDWLDNLLNSEILLNQKKLCGRAVLPDEIIYNFIKTVSSHGGTILQSTLAQSIGYPLIRIRGIISVMQRILNVDGYPVLTFDAASSTIKINNQLLRTQFKI